MGFMKRWCGWKSTGMQPRSSSTGVFYWQKSTHTLPRRVTPRNPAITWATSLTRTPSTQTGSIHSAVVDVVAAADADAPRRPELRRDLFDRLVRLGVIERDQQP